MTEDSDTPARRPVQPGEGPTGEQLKSLYDRLTSIREIARATGLSYSTVYRRLRKAGTRFRPPGTAHALKKARARLRRDYPIDARPPTDPPT